MNSHWAQLWHCGMQYLTEQLQYVHCGTSVLCWHLMLPRRLHTASYHCGWTTPTLCYMAHQWVTSTGYRSHRTHWSRQCAMHHALTVPPSYVGNFIGCQFATYKTAVITYKSQSTGTPAYLAHLIRDYLPARILWSSELLLLTVPRTTLALSTKVFSVSAPSVWNSLTYNCRSAELLSTYGCNLKLSYLTLLTVNVNIDLVSATYAPLIRWRRMALHIFVLIDWYLPLILQTISTVTLQYWPYTQLYFT